MTTYTLKWQHDRNDDDPAPIMTSGKKDLGKFKRMPTRRRQAA